MSRCIVLLREAVNCKHCKHVETQRAFVLNANGSGTANATYHSAGCGDGTARGLPITITSLNSNGSGTANLSCGTGCGFNFSIQVAPDRFTFNLVDVSDPGNYLEGTAIHQ